MRNMYVLTHVRPFEQPFPFTLIPALIIIMVHEMFTSYEVLV